jgi:hypothetical protein
MMVEEEKPVFDMKPVTMWTNSSSVNDLLFGFLWLMVFDSRQSLTSARLNQPH